MRSETAVAIARTEAAGRVNPDEPIEDRLRAAMKATWRHWMATEEDDQFQAAIEAVYLSATDEDKQRIEDEMLALRDLAGLLNGLPIDPERIHKAENPIGLRALWLESTERD